MGGARVVGVDLGGTKIFGAVVDTARSGLDAVVADAKVATPTGGAADVVDGVVGLVRSLDDAPRAVGVGTPGVVDAATGTVLYAPNLAGFDEPVDLAGRLADRLGCPVTVGNDVNVAALGEVRAGAAAGHDDVLAVWLGTGVGAGLVLDGGLRVGPNGLAGELGHTIVVPGGEVCGCGGRGHLEAYLGRRSLERRAREAHAAGEATMLVDRAGDGPMKSKTFRAAYDAGDEVARRLLDEGFEALGIAVVNVAVLVDVAAVVVGGGLGERFGALVTERLAASLDALGSMGAQPRLLAAALGDHAGALGAAYLAGAAS